MIELDKWIYSQDIAKWLLSRPALDIDEQMYCILSAPHRNLEEKLEGLRELQKEAGSIKPLKDKIEASETLLGFLILLVRLSRLKAAVSCDR